MPTTPEEKRAYMIAYNKRPDVIARQQLRKASPDYKAAHAEHERHKRAATPKRVRTAYERARWQKRKQDPEYMEKARVYQREWMRIHRASWTPEQKKAAVIARVAWLRAQPGKERGYQRKYNYGITPEQWEAMFEAQGRLCAICKSPEPHGSKGWQTDHCHVTNKIRGILCADCNRVVHNRTNATTLAAAAEYLETKK